VCIGTDPLKPISILAADIPSPLRPARLLTFTENNPTLKEFCMFPATKPENAKSLFVTNFSDLQG
jgi:hypothetical protein